MFSKIKLIKIILVLFEKFFILLYDIIFSTIKSVQFTGGGQSPSLATLNSISTITRGPGTRNTTHERDKSLNSSWICAHKQQERENSKNQLK